MNEKAYAMSKTEVSASQFKQGLDVPQPQAEISMVMDDLQRTMHRVSEKIGALAQYIAPVMRESCPTENEAKKAQGTMGSRMGALIQEMNDAALRQERTLVDMIDRIVL